MNFNFTVLEQHRLRVGNYRSESGDTFGAFLIPFRSHVLKVLATDGKDYQPEWEHVSVSLTNRCPNWQEMSYIKSLFFSDEETVIQFHVPKSMHINQHPNCLHLWRKVNFKQPLPPKIYVGNQKEDQT